MFKKIQSEKKQFELQKQVYNNMLDNVLYFWVDRLTRKMSELETPLEQDKLFIKNISEIVIEEEFDNSAFQLFDFCATLLTNAEIRNNYICEFSQKTPMLCNLLTFLHSKK
jgi:hypothetical protein